VKSQFLAHLTKAFPAVLKNPVLVACSGGLDSIVLAHLLQQSGCDIGLAHVNFNLRGVESDADQEFVYNFSKKLQVPFYQASFDTTAYSVEHRISIQMAARELRYRWFDEIARDFKYDLIATAHHADDDLETMLINLSRGSGIRGLSGIPQKNEKVIRPLLPFTKDELLEYARGAGLSWREDSSNASNDYLRNALRNQVIPTFTNVAPSISQGSYRSRQHLSGVQKLLDDYIAYVSKRVVTHSEDALHFDIPGLTNFSHSEELLYQLLQDYGFTAWDDIYALLYAQSGKQVFSPTHVLLKDRDQLILSALKQPAPEDVIDINSMEQFRDIPWLEYSLVDAMEKATSNQIFVSLNKLRFPLQIRSWREGDYFYPFGMTGKKKLSKFFKDEKLSLQAKQKVRLLCSGNQIIWIIGYRADNRFRVDQDSEKILKLTLLKTT